MRTQGRARKSLRVSFFDGVFASLMTGLISDYVAPYALALKATTAQIGVLSAVPNFFASLAQLKCADVAERWKSRKKVIGIFIILQIAMGVPIIFLPYFAHSWAVIALIALVTLFSSANAFTGPPWAGLMSEYIPPRARGKYFGWRNKLMAAVTVAASYTAGFILNHFHQHVLSGFMFIMSLAVACRFVSWCFLMQMYEPPYHVHRDAYFGFLEFLGKARESNFARFVLFVASLNFCVNLAAPFFAVFMLHDLKFSYLMYTVMVTTVTVAHIATLDRWGAHADKVGNLKVLRVTAFLIAGLPLWWIVNRNPVYLVFAQVVSGFAWAGFNLCATNFVYDAVTPQKRVRCFAYFNVVNGIAVSAGALIGGLLVANMPGLLGYPLLSLFLFSSILRFVVVFFFLRRIQEVRPAQDVSAKDLLSSMIGIRPLDYLRQTQD